MTDTAPSDIQLLDRARSGDEASFTELYVRHHAAAMRLAASYRRSGDPDELVNEAFEKVLGALRRGSGPTEAFRAYLFVTLRRLAAERAQRPADEPLDEVPEQVVAVAAEPGLDAADRSIVARAFESLPDRWQTVLWHTAVEGHKPGELATTLGVSANAASAMAYRAREKLRQAYLQAHLAAAPHPSCEPHRSRLGAYVRDGLSDRERAAAEKHLEGCESCRALVAELHDVNRLLARAVLPLFLIDSPGAAAAVAAAGADGTGSLLPGKGLWGRVRDVGPVTAGTATAVVVAGAIAVLAAVGTREDPSADTAADAAGLGSTETTEEPSGDDPLDDILADLPEIEEPDGGPPVRAEPAVEPFVPAPGPLPSGAPRPPAPVVTPRPVRAFEPAPEPAPAPAPAPAPTPPAITTTTTPPATTTTTAPPATTTTTTPPATTTTTTPPVPPEPVTVVFDSPTWTPTPDGVGRLAIPLGDADALGSAATADAGPADGPVPSDITLTVSLPDGARTEPSAADPLDERCSSTLSGTDEVVTCTIVAFSPGDSTAVELPVRPVVAGLEATLSLVQDDGEPVTETVPLSLYGEGVTASPSTWVPDGAGQGTLTVTVPNDGDHTVAGVTVELTWATGGVSADPGLLPDGCTAGDGGPSDPDVVCTLDPVPAGDDATVTFTLDVTGEGQKADVVVRLGDRVLLDEQDRPLPYSPP